MRFRCYNGLLALVAAHFLALPLRGEEAPVAVIDVSRVFREYVPFRDKLEELKREAKFTNNLSGIRCDNSPQRDALTLPRVPVHHGPTGMSKKEFLTREAELYCTAYAAMRREIAAYCQANDIRLVLRSESVASAVEVRRRMNNESWHVFWADNAVDITDEIIARMNGKREKE